MPSKKKKTKVVRDPSAYATVSTPSRATQKAAAAPKSEQPATVASTNSIEIIAENPALPPMEAILANSSTADPEKQNDHTDNTDDIASWVSLSLAQTQAEARVDKELQLKDRMAATGPVVVLSEKSEQMVIEKIRAGELELPVPDVEQLVGVKDWTRSINFVFETLVKYGFSEDDIRDAMQATKGAGDILDMLSWLCFHVPADRLPVDMRDKLEFAQLELNGWTDSKDKGKDKEVSMPERAPTPVPESAPEPVPELKPAACIDDGVNSSASNGGDSDDEYLVQAMECLGLDHHDADDYDSDEDPGLVHARRSVRRAAMEEWVEYLRTNNQRNRYGSQITKLADLIAKENKALSELQDDWLFDEEQSLAEYERIWPQYHETLLGEICAFKDRAVEKEAIDKVGAQANAGIEENMKPSAEKARSAKSEADFFADNSGSDSDVGFGFGFGDSDAEEDDALPVASTSSLRIVETALPAGWTGASMKDIVTETVHRIDKQAEIKYSSALRGSGYISNLTVAWSTPGIATSQASTAAPDSIPLDPPPGVSCTGQSHTYEMPGGIFGKTRCDAEDYIALVYLFSQARLPQLVRRLPPVLRDEWDSWNAHIRESERTAADAEQASRVDYLRRLRSQYVEMATASLAAESPEKSGKKKGNWSKQQHFAKLAVERRTTRWKHNVIPERQSTDKWKSTYAETQAALPAQQHKRAIVDALIGSQVVVIRGATGCGKTTQVPQIALHLLLSATYKGGRILCTQPRRISATSISHRVSLEVGDEQIGTKDSLVGYQVRLNARAVDENPLVFCTTGVLLRMLVEDPQLTGINCVICDEIQERTLELDYLLIVLRRLLAKRPDLKVILMSATIDTTIFTYYFDNCPVVDIPGRTFPVTSMFLENVIQMSGYVLDNQSFFAEKPEPSELAGQSFSFNVTTRGGNSARHAVDVSFDETRTTFVGSGDYNREQSLEDPSYVSLAAWSTVRKMRTDVVNLELIHHLIRCICSGKDEVFLAMCSKMDVSEGAILVFLPGIFEIRKLHGMLGSDKSINHIASIVPLHSAFSNEICPGTNKTYADIAFEIFPQGKRKVVLATNIAETGITIPDVTIVIDSGVANQAIWDKKRRMTRIETAAVSKANVKQRSGRAGRVQKGLTLCLFSSKQYALMHEYEAPEMHRLPLIGVAMMVKMHGFNDISRFLTEAIDPPQQSSVAQAIHELKEAGAVDEAEELTPIGRHLCYLPVDLSIGKMLIVGTLLNCLDPVLTLAAAMSLGKPMLVRPFDPEERAAANAAHAKYRKYRCLSYADDKQLSDLLVILSAYEDWRTTASTAGKTRRNLHDFCKRNWINRDAMDALEDYREQYLRMLSDLNLVRVLRNEQNKHVPFGHLIRPRARDVPGFSGGFTVPPAHANVNGKNVNVLYAAIIAGFDHIVMPAASGRGFEIAQISVAKKVRGISHAIQIEERQRVSTRPVVIDRSSVNASPDHPFSPKCALIAANLSGSGDATFANMSTRVNLASVVLFARSLTYWPKAKLLTINRWIDGKCYAKTALVLLLMRSVMLEIMNFRVASPLAKLPERLVCWQTAIVEVLRNESC